MPSATASPTASSSSTEMATEKLSRTEYPQPEIFDAVDANKDGFATLEEVTGLLSEPPRSGWNDHHTSRAGRGSAGRDGEVARHQRRRQDHKGGSGQRSLV